MDTVSKKRAIVGPLDKPRESKKVKGNPLLTLVILNGPKKVLEIELLKNDILDALRCNHKGERESQM